MSNSEDEYYREGALNNNPLVNYSRNSEGDTPPLMTYRDKVMVETHRMYPDGDTRPKDSATVPEISGAGALGLLDYGASDDDEEYRQQENDNEGTLAEGDEKHKETYRTREMADAGKGSVEDHNLNLMSKAPINIPSVSIEEEEEEEGEDVVVVEDDEDEEESDFEKLLTEQRSATAKVEDSHHSSLNYVESKNDIKRNPLRRRYKSPPPQGHEHNDSGRRNVEKCSKLHLENKDETSSPESQQRLSASPLKQLDTSVLARSVQSMREEEIAVPEEPPTSMCDPELQKKVRQSLQRINQENFDFNKGIQDNKDFRNPSIYEKLVSFLDIDERGSNFPPNNYNPHRWTSRSSYYDELARVQNEEMAKRAAAEATRKNLSANTCAAALPHSHSHTGLITKAQAAAAAAAQAVRNFTVSSIVPAKELRKKSKWDAPPPS